jgi:hypothetical protein
VRRRPRRHQKNGRPDARGTFGAPTSSSASERRTSGRARDFRCADVLVGIKKTDVRARTGLSVRRRPRRHQKNGRPRAHGIFGAPTSSSASERRTSARAGLSVRRRPRRHQKDGRPDAHGTFGAPTSSSASERRTSGRARDFRCADVLVGIRKTDVRARTGLSVRRRPRRHQKDGRPDARGTFGAPTSSSASERRTSGRARDFRCADVLVGIKKTDVRTRAGLSQASECRFLQNQPVLMQKRPRPSQSRNRAIFKKKVLTPRTLFTGFDVLKSLC